MQGSVRSVGLVHSRDLSLVFPPRYPCVLLTVLAPTHLLDVIFIFVFYVDGVGLRRVGEALCTGRCFVFVRLSPFVQWEYILHRRL